MAATAVGKDKNILYVGTKGSKKGADDKDTLDKMQLSIGRQRVMYQGEIYDILNHPCFYCGSSLESDQKLFIWKLEKVDISYWLAISRFFCENCNSEVAVHLFYDPKRNNFKWYVPFQQVYHASVEAEREPYLECYEASGLVKVGEFHSHGRIPAFFSATDDEDEKFPGLYGVVSCGDDKMVYRAVLGADKQIFLTDDQMKAVVYDSGEDRQSWVLGWFHQVYNKSIGNGSHYVVLVGQEKTKAIYVPSYEMARFFEGIFHVYSIDRGLQKDYWPQDHHFLISEEELIWKKGDDMLLRPVIVLSAPDAGTADPIYWSVGDVQKVVIDQKTYEFRCVDTNYYDKSENHQKLALFLCDDVIPANYGSEYSYLPDGEGDMSQVFLPGPVVNFGDESDYKYSKIHSWLSEHQNGIFQSFNCHIGVDSAFTGSTGKGRFSELSDQDLTVHSIGYQRLTARLFSLSVEEALKYKDYLWKLGDTDSDNPEAVTDNFCNGYWLRSPMGNTAADSGYAYIVDLVNGMIRPEAVKPDGSSTDEELRVTTSIGVRPAFAVPQG